MAKTKTDEALATIRTAVAAAKTLTDTEISIRQQHTALIAERRAVSMKRASEAECIENANRLVDQHAKEWAGDHGLDFVRQLGGHRELSGALGTSQERDVRPKLPHWGATNGTLTFYDLCGIVPDLVKARLIEVVHQSGAAFGLPAAERVAKLAEIDAQCAALEESHQALVDGAARVKIILPLLDRVRERRAAEELVASRARDLAAERARGEFLVNSGASVLSVGGRG